MNREGYLDDGAAVSQRCVRCKGVLVFRGGTGVVIVPGYWEHLDATSCRSRLYAEDREPIATPEDTE